MTVGGVTRQRSRLAVKHHTTRALVLRRSGFGEADLVVTFFTEALGQVSAVARGARKSQRRFGGALEPFHTLRVRLDERMTRDLMTVHEAEIDVVRARLVANLDKMEAAGRALAWVLRAAPPRTVEFDVWRELAILLDRLDEPAEKSSVGSVLAMSGLRLLQAFGWGLDLERCVRCGRECAEGLAATVDASAGGLVCRGCGGGRIRLNGASRMRLIDATRATDMRLEPTDEAAALELVERALAAHVHPR